MKDELLERIMQSNMDEQLKKDILERFDWIWEWNKSRIKTVESQIPKEFESVFRESFWDLLA